MIHFLVTIDTEEEREWGGSYKDHTHYTVENIKWLDPLQAIFDKHGVKATYLIDYPVAINKEALAILKRYRTQHNAEIGTHLHPWVNPPYEEELGERNSYTSNLPVELQLKKMTVLTDTIADGVGERPVTYRAGRYGFNESTVGVLKELNYTVDTSIVPFRQAKRSHEPHFGYMPSIEPYDLDTNNIMRPGQSGLLEVPLTVGFNKKVPRWLASRYVDLPNIGIRRVLKKALNLDLYWLRPSYANLRQMKELSEAVQAGGGTFLNMMFHSNELMPKGSKYCKTQEDVDNYLKRLDDYFSWLNRRLDVRYVTLKEMPAIYQSK